MGTCNSKKKGEVLKQLNTSRMVQLGLHSSPSPRKPHHRIVFIFFFLIFIVVLALLLQNQINVPNTHQSSTHVSIIFEELTSIGQILLVEASEEWMFNLRGEKNMWAIALWW